MVAKYDRFPPDIVAVEIGIPSGQSGGKEVESDIFCYQGKKYDDLCLCACPDGEVVSGGPAGDAARGCP
jgi:hypothetical protein